ncbi:MAG: septum formation initiator family protein [Gemmatimonadota bacterium]
MIRRLPLPLLLGLAFYYALLGGEYSVFEMHSVRGELERGRVELTQARDFNRSLEARADSLENHDPTLERLARERFGMIREGEVLYRFADPPDDEG